MGPVSSIFDLITFALLWFVYGANTSADQSFFHTSWFVLGLLSQPLVVHIIRTRKITFIQSRATLPVVIATGLVMVAGNKKLLALNRRELGNIIFTGSKVFFD